MIFPPFELSPEDSRISNPLHRPFWLPVPGAKTAALLIHGFTGSPWEMREPARVLSAGGISCLGIRLPGHGTTVADLARCRYEDWLATVVAGQQFLAADYRQIIVVGLSTGALLALAAQAQTPFTRLILLSPFLSFRNRLAPFAGLLRFILPYQSRTVDPALAAIYYAQRPVAGIYQLNRLRRHIEPTLAKVTAPALVICADGDLTIDPDSAVRLFHKLGSHKKELYRFGADVPHVLTTAENPQLQKTLQLITDFIPR